MPAVKSTSFKDGTKYPTVFGFRTGVLDVTDYDRGVMRQLGVQLQDPVIGDRPRLFMRVPGIQGTQQDKVSVVFVNPEQVFSIYKIPMVLVRREAVDPALERWSSPLDDYSIAAPGSVLKTKIDPTTGLCVGQGWDYLESKPRAWPYNFTYTIEVVARKRLDANKLLRKVLSVFPPYGNIVVIDSLDCPRSYFAQQGGFSDITEINDLLNRQPAFSISVTVWGELDHTTPVAEPGATQNPETGAVSRKTAEVKKITLWQKKYNPCYIGKWPK